ncbi:MAG: hypothetical protein WA136_04140 [Rhodoferax sp.]
MSKFMRLKLAAVNAVRKNKTAAAVVLTTVASTAMAADPVPPDPAVFLTYIAAAGVTLVAIYNAKLLLQLSISAFKWIRQALH